MKVRKVKRKLSEVSISFFNEHSYPITIGEYDTFHTNRFKIRTHDVDPVLVRFVKLPELNYEISDEEPMVEITLYDDITDDEYRTLLTRFNKLTNNHLTREEGRYAIWNEK
jgi:hypothetical protein